jgi:hypothetical protein
MERSFGAESRCRNFRPENDTGKRASNSYQTLIALVTLVLTSHRLHRFHGFFRHGFTPFFGMLLIR